MKLRSKITLNVMLILPVLLFLGGILVWDRVQTAHEALLLVGLWVVAASGLAVYGALGRLTGPLERLAFMAGEWGQGRLDKRLGLTSDDEVGRVAQTFDRMASSLQAAHEQLESQVADGNRALQRSQRQLLEAAKLASVGELAAGVAHQINNPASIILMRSAGLAEREPLSTEGREDLEVVQRQIDKIRRIVEGLLLFSRQGETAFRPLSLNAVVARVGGLIGDLAAEEVDLRIEVGEGVPVVEADSGQMEQVLLNLVNNALEAMPRGGRLVLRTRGAGDAAVLEVEDNGCGIAPEDVGRIFDPFYSAKAGGQGTGLGLAVSYGIIERHGGTIQCSSTPGSGTRFVVCLPANGAAEAL